MRSGVRLGIDVGEVRVGVATCDPDGILATPVQTVPCLGMEPAATDPDIGTIVGLARSLGVVEVVVGWPLLLSGVEGASALRARRYAEVVAAELAPVPVRLVDERFTSVDAHRGLRASGVAGRRQRAVVDQAAAVLILQGALDAERGSGRPVGEEVGRHRRRKPRAKGQNT